MRQTLVQPGCEHASVHVSGRSREAVMLCCVGRQVISGGLPVTGNTGAVHKPDAAIDPNMLGWVMGWRV